MIRKLGCVVAIAGLILVLAWNPARAGDTIRLGHNHAWSNPALLLGLAHGDFERAGVSVAEHQFTNPADIITAIISGDLDAGAAPGPTLFTAALQGAKVKAVALLQGTNNPPIAYMVRTDSGIKAVQDLRGKTAGINNYGGTYDIYLRYWLEKHGVDPKTGMNIVILPVPSLLPAVVNKQIDIAPLAAFDLSTASQKYPGQIRSLFDYNDVMKEGTDATDNNGLILVMGEDFVRQHRNVAVEFLSGYLAAVRTMNKDPKKALDDWAKFVGNDTLHVLDAPPTIPNDGKVYMASLQFDANEAFHYGYLPHAIDVHTMVDNSLIEQAATATSPK